MNMLLPHAESRGIGFCGRGGMNECPAGEVKAGRGLEDCPKKYGCRQDHLLSEFQNSRNQLLPEILPGRARGTDLFSFRLRFNSVKGFRQWYFGTVFEEAFCHKYKETVVGITHSILGEFCPYLSPQPF